MTSVSPLPIRLRLRGRSVILWISSVTDIATLLRQIASGFTARTALQAQMAQYQHDYSLAAGDIVRSNLDDSTARLNNSHVKITVTNNGDNTASIRYEVVDSAGEAHFQNYLNFPVDSADMACSLVTEGSYLVLVD